MVTEKFRAVRQVLSADHVMLFTKKGNKDVVGFGFGHGGLSDMMLMAVEIKKSYNNITKMIDEAAVESGELHALSELKKTLEVIEDVRQ